MLFHIQGFKKFSTTGPVLDCPEKLYSLGVLNGKGQQELKLKDEILDKFVFCQVEQQATGYRIALERKLMASAVTARLRVLIRSLGRTFSDTLGPRNSTKVVSIP